MAVERELEPFQSQYHSLLQRPVSITEALHGLLPCTEIGSPAHLFAEKAEALLSVWASQNQARFLEGVPPLTPKSSCQNWKELTLREPRRFSPRSPSTQFGVFLRCPLPAQQQLSSRSLLVSRLASQDFLSRPNVAQTQLLELLGLLPDAWRLFVASHCKVSKSQVQNRARINQKSECQALEMFAATISGAQDPQETAEDPQTCQSEAPFIIYFHD